MTAQISAALTPSLSQTVANPSLVKGSPLGFKVDIYSSTPRNVFVSVGRAGAISRKSDDTKRHEERPRDYARRVQEVNASLVQALLVQALGPVREHRKCAMFGPAASAASRHLREGCVK